MPTYTVNLDWVKQREFLLKDRSGFPVVMAQPMGVNGADLLPMSLIGCLAWDVLAILQKQRQRVTRFEVAAESEQDEQPPWRFRKIRVIYRLTGRQIDEGAVQRAIQLTEQKYCSIHATLRDSVELSSDYEVISE
jgi:putative redox protein